VAVSVMQVGVVEMFVPQRLMAVPVRMRLRHRPVVTLPVVQVMDIHFIPESGAKPLQSIIACNDSRFAICSESAANSRYGCRRLRRSVDSCFYIYTARLRRFSGRGAGPGLPHRKPGIAGDPRFARRRAGRRRPMRSPALALNAAPSPNA